MCSARALLKQLRRATTVTIVAGAALLAAAAVGSQWSRLLLRFGDGEVEVERQVGAEEGVSAALEGAGKVKAAIESNPAVPPELKQLARSELDYRRLVEAARARLRQAGRAANQRVPPTWATAQAVAPGVWELTVPPAPTEHELECRVFAPDGSSTVWRAPRNDVPARVRFPRDFVPEITVAAGEYTLLWLDGQEGQPLRFLSRGAFTV